jgi:fibrillarin-like pre-rRNA processing protein
MEIKEVFPSIYKLVKNDQEILVTRNLTPGITYYGEPVFEVDEVEYRSWNPTRSKLGALILKGVKNMPIKPDRMVLYLGVASGTTLSHVSDILGVEGHVWGVDFAPRSMRDLLDKVSRHRNNISPILGDARNPSSYSNLVSMVDVVFADVAQPNQGNIIVENSRHFLRKDGWLVLTIKSRSIDVREKPKNIYMEQIKIIEEAGYYIHEVVEIDPFEKDHAIVLASSA